VSATPLLEVDGLAKHYKVRRGLIGRAEVSAVDDVTFTIGRGEIVGLVGESGSGKTTIGRALLRLIEPSAGRVRFDGADVTAASPRALRQLRRRMQIVFQDPYGSLDPRHRVGDLVGDGLAIHGIGDRRERAGRVASLLGEVGLAPEHATRYPHEFSGGQRQRIGIARALAVEPQFIVADEPVSALDVSVQAQVVNLLLELQERRRLALLFISHDLSLVEFVADRVIVLYLGRIVEIGPARALWERPRHPYTEALLSAVPTPDPATRRRRIVLGGEMPSPLAPPSGCAFRTRCPYAIADCAVAVPPLREVGAGQATACIRDDIL
jgi:oligopeptide/dipeptide ABC transporter ATP-binding protein